MKVCSTCKEEFADKFGFCPVDGTPLIVLVSKVEESADDSANWSPSSAVVSSASVPDDVPNVLIEPIDSGEPVLAGAGSLAGANSTALIPRGEYHLTMLDYGGLVRSLAKELSDVAHEYQLTWPEFKARPIRFTKRSLVGYGQMASKFFGNRNVIAGLIVAVVALAGLVGIMALLDRAQPGGISRTGFITFSIIAGVILAAIFITWLSKSRSGAVLGAPDAESNNAVLGMVVAFSFFLVLVGGSVLYNFWQRRVEEKQQASEQLIVENYIEIPNEQPTPDEGTAGMNKGKGGGSKPKQEKPGGGGGGGRQEQKPASLARPAKSR